VSDYCHESYTLYDVTLRKARKPHVCCGCGRGILPGHREPGYWPREDLGCGLDYEEEWEREPPPEIARLPLLSDDEAGQLLKPKEGPNA